MRRVLALCYGVGNGHGWAVVVAIADGVAGKVSNLPGALLSSIACQPAICLAVGARQSPHRSRAGSYGVFVRILSSKITATLLVPSTTGFISVAAEPVGTGFVALGNSGEAACEISFTA